MVTRSVDSGGRLAGGQRGFTYLGLLFAIALLGATLALTGMVWHTAQQREKERELLFIGNQFRQAIAAYYNHSPGTVKQFPQSLEELLKDPRQLTTQRYLRRIYADPITGKPEWGLVKSRDDRIVGVYSLSENEPLKQSNFREADKAFEGKLHYSEWHFAYVPPQPAPQAIQRPVVPPLQAIAPIQAKPAEPQPAPNQPPATQAGDDSICDTLLKNDAGVCQIAASKYGEETGRACTESAEARFAACREKQSTIGLPPLRIAPPDTAETPRQ